MFEGVFIYAHVVLGFSVFGMFKHMCKRHDCKTRLYGQTFVSYTNISTDISKQGTNCQLLLSVCSVAYAFSLWLVGRNNLWGDLTLTTLKVWEPFVYIFNNLASSSFSTYFWTETINSSFLTRLPATETINSSFLTRLPAPPAELPPKDPVS